MSLSASDLVDFAGYWSMIAKPSARFSSAPREMVAIQSLSDERLDYGLPAHVKLRRGLVELL